jgi:hypothetical protein
MTPAERADTIAKLERGIQERRKILAQNPQYPRREELEAKIAGLEAEANALRIKVQH